MYLTSIVYNENPEGTGGVGEGSIKDVVRKQELGGGVVSEDAKDQGAAMQVGNIDSGGECH